MIQFESVTKIYPDGTTAVSDFSLTVPSRRTVALVGSSGSGKTTLLRMVNRMVDPSSGRVLIDDEDVVDRDPVTLRRSIGYVLQNGGLLPHRTVLDNIATVPVLTGRPRKKARAEAKELLQRVGLDPALGDRYPAQLSGGQQQRVGVARALALDPNILLMDEPFGAVDPIVRGELQDELVRLQAELGKTIVFVTHDIEEAFRLGDEVVVLKEGGKIAQRGTPAEILASPADDFVREFVGLGRADLRLEVREVAGRAMVVDPDGRPVGFLGDDVDAGAAGQPGESTSQPGESTGQPGASGSQWDAHSGERDANAAEWAGDNGPPGASGSQWDAHSGERDANVAEWAGDNGQPGANAAEWAGDNGPPGANAAERDANAGQPAGNDAHSRSASDGPAGRDA